MPMVNVFLPFREKALNNRFSKYRMVNNLVKNNSMTKKEPILQVDNSMQHVFLSL
jgi:hypothetical protein